MIQGSKEHIKTQFVKVGDKLRLKEIAAQLGDKARVSNKIIFPLMLKFKPRDILQIIVGSSILAIPVAFTQETWDLGKTLPLLNVFGFLLLSILFISLFVYYNYYRGKLRENFDEFSKRVISTYVFSFIVVAVLMTLIQGAPWATDWVLAFKRITIATFPASMSAAVADMIR